MNYILYSFILLTLFFNNSLSLPKNLDRTCNILSLSGGGSFGAVEVGILEDLYNKNNIVSEFDIITGISAGGLNAAFLSYTKKVSDSINSLAKIYSSLRNEDVYEKDLIHILKNWGLYDTSPLEETITKILSTKIKEDGSPITLIGASNVNKQQLDIFHYDTANFSKQVDILMATSAIPMIFPPRKVGENLYIDGGSIDNEIIYQAMGQLKCDNYNYLFISASNKNVNNKNINNIIEYTKAVINLIVNTFDYELAGLKNISCLHPQGVIDACLPTDPELEKYNYLDFDNGDKLMEIGRNSYSCQQIPLC